MPAGQPTKYNLEMATRICEKVACSTESLKNILASEPDFPCRDTVYLWLYKHKEFSDMFAQAKMTQAQRMAEELDEIASEKAYYIDADGNKRVDPGYTASQRLIADTRKWIACKMIPKVYGDRQTIEQTVTVKHEDALKELE